MSDTVVDSSVVAKWILPEPDSADAQRLITDIALRGEQLIVLDLALIEVSNAVWRQYHRRIATLDEARLFLDALIRAPVRIEPATRLLRPALEIAARYERSIYDALFVALCADLGLPGVTADEPLIRALHPDYPNVVLLRDW
jgi:predicted nucleic acid-binding protein